MQTLEEIGGINLPANAELQEACERFAQGIRDPEAARQSRLRMAEARAEIRARLGVQDVVVDLVRRARESR